MTTESKDGSKRIDPNVETLLVHDNQTGSVKAITDIREKEGHWEETDAIKANQPAFVKVEKTGPLLNFYRNFMAQAKEPTRFNFYRVPMGEVANLTDALFKLQSDRNDTESRRTANKYRMTSRQLEKIKYDKAEMPWEELRAMGISREQLEKERFLEGLMHGKNTPATIPVKHSLAGGAGQINDTFALQLFRDENGKVCFDLIAPKSRPEFDEPEFKTKFSTDEKADLLKEKTLSRLVPIENRHTGREERCYISFDPSTNRLVTIPQRDIQVPDFMFRARLNDEQKELLRNGEKIYLQNGKQFNDVEFSGPVQYDVKRGDFISYNPRYHKPYIPEFIDKQLDDATRNTLMNYGEIDGTKVANRDGEPYRSAIGMDKESNTIYWGSRQRESQDQSHSQEASQTRGRRM